MAFTQISLSNFKSYHQSTISLSNFNIVVGANASGKSNFIQFFKFLKDIKEFGLDDAISMQGGAEYIFNAHHKDDKYLSCRLVDDHKHEFGASSHGEIGYEITNTTYELKIEFSRFKTYVKSVEESYLYNCDFFSYVKVGKNKSQKSSLIGSGKVIIVNSNGDIAHEIHVPESVNEELLKSNLFPLQYIKSFFSKRFKVGKRKTLLEANIPGFLYFGHDWAEHLQEISIFDIDPRLIKKAQPITGRHDLESDGSNLAAVIRRIGRNAVTRRQLENIVGELIPFVDSLSVKKLADNLIIRMREKFKSDDLFPAFLLSDGTINLAALSVILFFENKKLKIIEEPERNIHPHLISKIMRLLKDASSESQIITTTHNPEIIRYSNFDDLILVNRDQYGDSYLSKPAEIDELKHFLKNNIGVEELYVQNILEKYTRVNV
jgi:predicted ATPase